jgi:lysine 2,3-aminomutase
MPKPAAYLDDPLAEVARRYPVAVTPAIAALIDAAGPDDPIAAQFLPDARELITTPEELADPIGDYPKSPVEGIVHRYPDRVLLKATHLCAVYCRFCFRREMVGPDGDGTLSGEALGAALAYIASRPKLWEVILTGGDPFMVSARRATEVTHALAATGHVRIARWHTRVPIVDPERVTDAFVAALRAPGLTTLVAVHCNHARELTPASVAAIGRLVDAGIPVLGQSVLLAGVNADPDTLEALFRALTAARVQPYYLHHPDQAPGTGHFRLTLTQGRAIVEAVRSRISGHAMPAYVLDVPGHPGKVPVSADHVRFTATGATEVRDRHGVWRTFADQGTEAPVAGA